MQFCSFFLFLPVGAARQALIALVAAASAVVRGAGGIP